MANTVARDTARTTTRAPVQQAAFFSGVVFLIVGILGFIPGITTNFGAMEFAGHESGAMLLGIFQVSVLHNLVHIAFGVIGIAMAKTAPKARQFLLAGGIVYLVLWIYGLVVSPTSDANFVPLNSADNWLHLFLGAGMIALSFLHRRDTSGVNRDPIRRDGVVHDTSVPHTTDTAAGPDTAPRDPVRGKQNRR